LHVWGHLQTFVKAEGMLFPGVTVVALALLGLWRGGTLARGATLFAAVAVPLSFWLSLGPEIQTATEPVAFPAPYRWLWEYVPGYHAARVPARFATITILSLSLLAGLGLAVLEVRGRRLMVALCALAILAEGAAFPLPTNGTWTRAPGELVAPKPRLHT